MCKDLSMGWELGDVAKGHVNVAQELFTSCCHTIESRLHTGIECAIPYSNSHQQEMILGACRTKQQTSTDLLVSCFERELHNMAVHCFSCDFTCHWGGAAHQK